MIVSFSQTYGNQRYFLHDAHMKDTRMHELKNLMDLNIYSFHNVPINVKKDFLKRLPVDRVLAMTHNTPKYSTTIKRLKEYLNHIKATHLFWTQDDTFSLNNTEVDWKEFLEFVRFEKKGLFLTMKEDCDDFVDEWKPDMEFSSFNVYKRTVQDFIDHGFWAMCDEPCMLSMDVFNEIYDDDRLLESSIWSMETYANHVWQKKGEHPRWVLDQSIFQNYNIWGLCTADQKERYDQLKERGLVEGDMVILDFDYPDNAFVNYHKF